MANGNKDPQSQRPVIITGQGNDISIEYPEGNTTVLGPDGARESFPTNYSSDKSTFTYPDGTTHTSHQTSDRIEGWEEYGGTTVSPDGTKEYSNNYYDAESDTWTHTHRVEDKYGNVLSEGEVTSKQGQVLNEKGETGFYYDEEMPPVEDSPTGSPSDSPTSPEDTEADTDPEETGKETDCGALCKAGSFLWGMAKSVAIGAAVTAAMGLLAAASPGLALAAGVGLLGLGAWGAWQTISGWSGMSTAGKWETAGGIFGGVLTGIAGMVRRPKPPASSAPPSSVPPTPPAANVPKPPHSQGSKPAPKKPGVQNEPSIAPSTTKPTGQSGGQPSGRPTKIPKHADEATKKGLELENQAAHSLAKNGYRVEQNPVARPNGKKPDFKIEGEYFDAYSPRPGTPVQNIRSTLEGKLSKGQAERFVINMSDNSTPLSAVKDSIKDIPGLQEVIVVRGDSIIQLFP